ncbi:hypothetical protein CEB3_c16330 [Peptococcaceae bacterium CEB3]|nr:hypothetical protein CEB3_c16330 [Peptococcaceae bacterium CEB3]
MKKLTKVAAVTVSSFLVVGLGGVAALADTLPAGLPSAPPPLVKAPLRPHVRGTIASVSGDLMTLKTPSKTVTVKLSSGTVYDRGPAQRLNLSDLKAGAEVDVDGSWDNGTFDALHVHLDVPHVHGTITSVSSDQLTLKTPSKTVTVKLSSGTVYDRGPAQKLNLSDLKAGAEVDVDGSWNNGTFDALHVHLAPPHRDGLPGHPGKKPDGLGGKIAGVTSRSLTVKAPDGRTFIVSLTGNTKLDSGPQSIGTSALQAGKDVHIRLVGGEQVPPPSPSSTSTISKTISNLTAAEVDLVPPHLNLNSHPIIQRGPGNTSSQLTVGMNRYSSVTRIRTLRQKN